ncbi:MAG: hypothetical protein KF847_09925 [Pirellulales bacterium]|nr:hypothetical protein [Pirellulales bacterium]
MIAFIPLLVIALVVLFVTTAAGARGHKIAAALGGLALLGMLAAGATYRAEYNARRAAAQAEIRVAYDTAVAAARKQGRQADVSVQPLDDGRAFERYPDGSQFLVGADGTRVLVQGRTRARTDPGTGIGVAKYSIRNLLLALFLPLVSIAGAAVLLRRRRDVRDEGERRAGLGLIGLGVAAFLVAGFLATGSTRTTIPGPAPLVSGDSTGTASQDVPLDALWDKLTAPRIALDGEPVSEAPLDNAGDDPASGSPAVEEESAGDDIAVAPGDKPKSGESPERPKWLDAPPTLGDGLRREIVSTAPFATLKECHDELLVLISGKVRQRIAVLTHGVGARGGVVPQLTRMSLRIDQLLDQIVVDQYIEPVDASFGDMLKAHVLLEFGPEVDERLIAAWQAYVRRDRLGAVAATAGACVGVVALAFGLLKLDTWTRGYYTKRLFLGVPAAIIGALALLGLLS